MPRRDALREIVDNNTTKKGMIFDYCIQALIFISLTAYAIETLPNHTPETKAILTIVEVASSIVFTIEYALRIYVAKKPLKYIFSFTVS